MSRPASDYHSMGLRLCRRLRIARGFTLNLYKRGAGVSVGRRGFHVTGASHGVRETVGIPGTGISYTATRHPSPAKARPTIGSMQDLVNRLKV